MKERKFGLYLVMCFLLVTGVMFMTDSNTKASVTEEYFFKIGGNKVLPDAEYEMMSDSLEIASNETIASDAKVTWEVGEPMVIDVLEVASPSSINKIQVGPEPVKLARTGPGYATLKATIIEDGYTKSIECLIKVNLILDDDKTGIEYADGVSTPVLKMDLGDSTKQRQIYLENIADTTKAAVSWESDNTSVVTVDKGMVTAVGAGMTTVTVKTNTKSKDGLYLKKSLYVVVKPKFSLNYDSTVKTCGDDDNSLVKIDNVPPNFVIESNANIADNLYWVVKDLSTGKVASTDKVNPEKSSISGNVSFRNVKAGRYVIYAFSDKQFVKVSNEEITVNKNVPYACIQINVPLAINKDIVMGVNDIYNILKNSNIPSLNDFAFEYENTTDKYIAAFDKNTGNISAKKVGKIKLTLDFSNEVFYPYNVQEVYVTVIDGIKLDMTKATIYENGSLQLIATYTDSREDIVWNSSNKSIATVNQNGLVTALAKGTAEITATITDSTGVEKTATCVITVKKPVTKVTLEPKDALLSIGEFKTLVADIEPEERKDVILDWRTSNEAVVKIDKAYDSSSVIQAVGSGNAVVTAIDKDNVVVGYCHVVVKEPVAKIELSETKATVPVYMKKLQLRAFITPSNATNQKVNWKSADTSIATVDSNGLVTILKTGTVSIIASSDDNPKLSEVCNLTIDVPVQSISLDKTAVTMYAGETTRLTYQVLPSNATDNSVTWTSTNTGVATVDATGKVTAKSSGTTAIILRSADGGLIEFCNITVKQVASGVKLDAAELNMAVGGIYHFKPTLTPKDSTDTVLVWESSNTKVAKIDSDGKLTALGAGTAVIMVKAANGATDYCTVTVTQRVNGLTLNYKQKSIYKGDKFDLKAKITPDDATNTKVTWKSMNTGAVTVSSKGEVKGVAGGVAVIICTADDGGYIATCMVTVKELSTSVKLNYSSYRLGLKKSFNLKATVKTETATNKNVTWSTSNRRIATVNQKGKVTAISKGYVTITATAKDGSGAEASCEIRVVTPVSSVRLSKGYMTIIVGQTKSLKVSIKPSNATYKTAKWTSGNSKIARVDEDGRVIGIKAGSTIITAAARDNSGKKALCYVSVIDRVPATGVIAMDKSLAMVPGEQKTVQVVLNPATSTDSYTWSSDNSAVAYVNKKTGRITARATGTANITVMTSSGKTAVVAVTVVGLNIKSITLEQYTTYPYKLIVEGTNASVNWSVDNPEIAVVTRSGSNSAGVSSRGVGTTYINATVNGRKLRCKLQVTKIK